MNLDKEIDKLNEFQKESVLHMGSPLLILAGPGSGKTRVVTTKIAWLIQELDIKANSILAMTFTNKAAREMSTRINSFNQNEEKQGYIPRPFISTFHSCGAYLLRRYCEEAGLERDFQIYDATDQLSLLKESNPKIPAKMLRATLSGISRAKDYGLGPDSPAEELEVFVEDRDVYKNYERLKENTGNVDFGDLLTKPYLLMKKNKDISSKIKAMWKWFFVDEYQDTNTIQSLWLHELCKDTANLTVVGDDDQSIYRFRGAIVENILNFEHIFSNTKIIHLGQNYRSTPEIVCLANEVISNNHGRHGKTVFSKEESGELPKILYFPGEFEEENFVTKQAKETRKNNQSMAIFYRTNSQSRPYEMALRRANIPYEIVGAVGFFERAEIKDAIALMRVYRNALDIISFSRIVNKPARGIGKASLELILEQMKNRLPWHRAWKIVEDKLSKKARAGLEQLELILNVSLNIFEEDAEEENDSATLGDVMRTLLEKSKLWDYYLEEDEEQKTDRIENLEEAISYAMDFPNTQDGWISFFEQVSLNEGISQNAEEVIEENRIQLITLHRSKGLEFDTVIICGVEDGLLPMIGDGMFVQEEIEEERRLFYVGLTRAKKQLALTCCQARRRYGRMEDTEPSQFLEEFDRDLVEWISCESATVSRDGWNVGDRVKHLQYGMGYVRKVIPKEKLLVVHVEFDNEYEATFIPKFARELEKVDE